MSVSIQLDHGTSFTQWDTGRYIYILGYQQTDDVKVHYTTSASGVAFVVLPIWDTDKFKADVPSTILTVGRSVNVYLYDEDLEENRTVYKEVVPVVQRAKPSDYIYDSYTDNELIWPYEENIEAILRREADRILAESARSVSESTRSSNETTRIASENARVAAELLRISAENARQLTLQSLQTELDNARAYQQEVIGARGTDDTLGDRLERMDVISVVSVTIDENASILVEFSNGQVDNIGQIPNTSATSIVNIERTSGDGSSGSTDTYTITLDDDSQYTFTVYNGADGPRGLQGVSGVYIGDVDPGSGYSVWIDTQGEVDPGIRGTVFTPSVSEAGVLSWSNDGELNNPTPVNIKGDTGDPGVYVGVDEPTDDDQTVWINPNELESNIQGTTFTPSVDASGTLSWTNNGGRVNPNPVNIKGPIGNTGATGSPGATFTPSVDSSGNLSWSNNAGLANPTTRNIKGPQGTPGTNGTNGTDGADGTNGEDGADGVTFTPSVDANGNLSWTNNGGLSNPATVNIKGPQGDPGEGGGEADGGNADTLEGHPASYFALSDHTHAVATTSTNGMMSSTDKSALDTMKGSSAQAVGSGDSPTFGTVTADVVVGAVYQ